MKGIHYIKRVLAVLLCFGLLMSGTGVAVLADSSEQTSGEAVVEEAAVEEAAVEEAAVEEAAVEEAAVEESAVEEAAVEEAAVEEAEPADTVGDGSDAWSNLQSAINEAAANTETVITLTEDLIAGDENKVIRIVQTKNIVIDLNGHTVDRNLDSNDSAYGSVFEVFGKLTIRDSSEGQNGLITGGYTDLGGGVFVASSGSFYFESGRISGNLANKGAGVFSRGSMSMTGGSIDQNSAFLIGGGIYSSGTLTMTDGLVMANTSQSDGGGIVNENEFSMSGGSILDNTAVNSAGAIRIYEGAAVTMSGGTISGNKAQKYHGGAIYNSGTLTMTGGAIENNESGYQGGGILQASGAALNVSGNPVIKDNVGVKGNNVYIRPSTLITVAGTLEDEALIGVYMESGTGVFTSGLSGNGKSFCFASDDTAYQVCTNEAGEAYLGTESVTVTFDAAGSEGTMEGVVLGKGADYKLPENGFTSPEHRKFSGWNLTVGGTADETVYTAGAYIKVQADTTITPVWGDVKVHYMDRDGNLQYCEDCRKITNGSDNLYNGWYYVGEDVTLDYRLKIQNGHAVNLILADGVTLNATKGIRVPVGSTLAVWSQSLGDKMGSLIAVGSREEAGIGGEGINSWSENAGTMIFNGGNIKATGGKLGAGIGGGRHGSGGTTYIYNGNIVAEGGESAAGIGGGYETGGTVLIYGGTVTARGGYDAPAIGRGYYRNGTNRWTNISIAEDMYIVEPAGGSYYNVADGNTRSSAIVDYYGAENPRRVVIQKEHITVSFDSDGGEGTMKDVYLAAGGTFTLPECSFTAPAESLTFKGWRIGDEEEEVANPGDTITFEEDTVVTAVWDGTIKVTVDFGEGQEQYVADYYEQYWKEDGYTVSSDNPSQVIMDVEYGSSIEDAIYEFDIRIGMVETKCNNLKFSGELVLHEVDDYDSYNAVMTEMESYENMKVYVGLVLNALWLKPVTEASITVERPYCGTEVIMEEEIFISPDGEEILYEAQNPTPEFTISGQLIPGTEIYPDMVSTDSQWIADGSAPTSYEAGRFLGTMEGDGVYYAWLRAFPAFGYYIDNETIADVLTVNGEDPVFMNSFMADVVEVVVPLKVLHDYEEISYTWADDNSSVTAMYECTTCGTIVQETAQTTSVMKNGITTYTAVFENEDFETQTKKVVTDPSFKTQSLLLSGQIGVVFFLDLPAVEGINYDESYMEFTISGKNGVTTQVPYSEAELNPAGTYYGFTYYINSIQMADTITATFHYGDNKTIEKTYSAVRYLNAIAKGNYAEPLKNLCAAINDYGYFAQQYLSPLRGWEIGTDHAATTSDTVYTAEDVETAKNAVSDNGLKVTFGDSQLKKVTYSLLLDTKTGIRLYLAPMDGFTGEVTAYLGDGTEVPAVKQSDGRYTVNIPGIVAHKLGETFTVTGTMGDEFEIKISALSYVRSVLNKTTTSDEFKYSMTALYNYYIKTVEYLESMTAQQ